MVQQQHVLERYSHAAQSVEADLCCPVNYDRELLAMLPPEIVEKDYGCGDPSRYVRETDAVLDLGSGGGKICYMAAKIVGDRGRVTGVDMNDNMLALARKYQNEMAIKLGGDRVRFVKARIQDLALDLEAVDQHLKTNPVRETNDLAVLQAFEAEQRGKHPLIPDASIDVVISNCVLNLVGESERAQMVREIYRVLKPGGRVAISDIVSDEAVPEVLRNDPTLWSGCISGAFQESAFLKAFSDTGFLAVSYDKWDAKPWRTVRGIEFRAVTLTAVKGDNATCLDYGHAVLYRGPYASITDDEGHVFPRGERIAVCERSFSFLTQGPLKHDFIGITPAVPRDPPTPWCMPAGAVRPAAVSKGARHDSACGNGGCC
ncbi:MAG: methyltransferase domain-containing protein [Acidiferrobacterales bacterium]